MGNIVQILGMIVSVPSFLGSLVVLYYTTKDLRKMLRKSRYLEYVRLLTFLDSASYWLASILVGTLSITVWLVVVL